MNNALPAHQYIDRNGNVRTIALRHRVQAIRALCTCPSDCNCQVPWRPTYCGCKAHS